MRMFYVFSINEYFSSVYKDKAYRMYKMLEELYYISDYDIISTSSYYEQILEPFNKEEINRYLYNQLYQCDDYYKRNNTHIICDNFEYTKLVIDNDRLKIKTNQKNPKILSCLNNYQENVFVCDFNNKEYFWLKKHCQMDKNLVK